MSELILPNGMPAGHQPDILPAEEVKYITIPLAEIDKYQNTIVNMFEQRKVFMEWLRAGIPIFNNLIEFANANPQTKSELAPVVSWYKQTVQLSSIPDIGNDQVD